MFVATRPVSYFTHKTSISRRMKIRSSQKSLRNTFYCLFPEGYSAFQLDDSIASRTVVKSNRKLTLLNPHHSTLQICQWLHSYINLVPSELGGNLGKYIS